MSIGSPEVRRVSAWPNATRGFAPTQRSRVEAKGCPVVELGRTSLSVDRCSPFCTKVPPASETGAASSSRMAGSARRAPRPEGLVDELRRGRHERDLDAVAGKVAKSQERLHPGDPTAGDQDFQAGRLAYDSQETPPDLSLAPRPT